jgi:hypothetical protein
MRSLIRPFCFLLAATRLHALPPAELQSVLSSVRSLEQAEGAEADVSSPTARGEQAMTKVSLVELYASRSAHPSDLQHYNPFPHHRQAAELRMPGGLARDIPSKRIHSHNDYWREVPLYTALSHGVTSIEADVWLNPKDGRLYVGSSEVLCSSLLG